MKNNRITITIITTKEKEGFTLETNRREISSFKNFFSSKQASTRLPFQLKFYVSNDIFSRVRKFRRKVRRDGRPRGEREKVTFEGSKDESSSEDEVGNDSFLLTNWEVCIPLMGRRKVFG